MYLVSLGPASPYPKFRWNTTWLHFTSSRVFSIWTRDTADGFANVEIGKRDLQQDPSITKSLFEAEKQRRMQRSAQWGSTKWFITCHAGCVCHSLSRHTHGLLCIALLKPTVYHENSLFQKLVSTVSMEFVVCSFVPSFAAFRYLLTLAITSENLIHKAQGWILAHPVAKPVSNIDLDPGCVCQCHDGEKKAHPFG